MGTSFQISVTGTTPVYALHEAPLPRTAWLDRNGETWVPAGHTSRGELILACPEPTREEDCGEGASFPWTLSQVEAAFGPLMARADVEERRLAEVDTEFLELYGPDQRVWKRWQVDTYLDAIDRVHDQFGPSGVAA
ncbi:hypothetical protein DV517_61630 [Streptomyces sp. S816]|uniref:hypothetical protein n=1 Tax=Streptomyces sp. S816 TaxID=2283197 RepID=UPI00109D393C|nr:hypothetical protein [Streptomyces sp. S816]TGZ14680.1 hypothetical protein DV517_61630 [Streptomyces sp. S816]